MTQNLTHPFAFPPASHLCLLSAPSVMWSTPLRQLQMTRYHRHHKSERKSNAWTQVYSRPPTLHPHSTRTPPTLHPTTHHHHYPTPLLLTRRESWFVKCLLVRHSGLCEGEKQIDRSLEVVGLGAGGYVNARITARGTRQFHMRPGDTGKSKTSVY